MPAPTPLHLKVFIGSPSDVDDERERAWDVLTRLPHQPAYRGKVTFEAVAWNLPHPKIPLLANIPAQSSVNWIKGEPAACDVVVIILWSRLGSPSREPEYAKPGGGFFTGTEWEFDNALQASAASSLQRPKVLLYHRQDKPPAEISEENEAAILKQMEDIKQVGAFMRKCHERGIAINGYAGGASEFAAVFAHHLEEIVCKCLEEYAADNPTHSIGEKSNPTLPKAMAEPFWTGSPFPGLRPFTDKDSPIFFGRGRETDELLARLRDPAQRFIAVVGASGSGKSSLVWAGLIPRLMQGALEGSADWAWVRFTPGKWGDNPFTALAACWEPALEAQGQSVRELAEALQKAPEQLDGCLRMALANRPASAELLLFIDQFEELFTVVNPDYRTAFVRFMRAVASSKKARLIVSVRADFYAQCVEQGLAEVLRTGSYPLAAPGSYALSQMVTQPAALGGLEFEAGLVDAILANTGDQPGALPLLAFALELLYQARTEQGLLTHRAYTDFGEVQGAIGLQADKIFAALAEDVKDKFTEVFRELVEVDERGVPTRRRAKLSEVAHSVQARQLIDALTKARLLVGDSEKADEITVVGRNKPAPAGVSGMIIGGMPETVAVRPYSGLLQNDNSTASNDANNPIATLEVAHEALFKSWKQLADWVTQTADDHRLRRQIGQLAAYWEAHERQDAHRWPDERVVEVSLMLEHLGLDLENFSEMEQAFLGPIDPDDLLKAIAQPETTHELRAMIGVRLDRLGDTRKGVGLRKEDGLPDIDWVHIPGGEVTIEIRADANEPDSAVAKTLIRPVESFSIARYPVTVVQFQAFLRECHDGKRWHLPKGAPFDLPDSYAPSKPRARHGNHPADSVNWYDAVTFCHWLSVRLGYPVRLPTEFEWQCAAIGGLSPSHLGRGVGERDEPSKELNPKPQPPTQNYPWGQDWDPTQEPWRANSVESDLGRATAVGMYPGGMSAAGVCDLSGTVWEWCQNAFDNPDEVAASTAGAARVPRGGSWYYDARDCRSACRSNFQPDLQHNVTGFRCARVQA
ncbi:MAG: SUMF1/EgtB/PvdO family nonheme iron enzyme [Proteobacteria bacterium]|nr:SUMF1/EgtB/PvdO family nonheme iron enzyme [Pseudomonadota bacterium]